MSRVAWLVNVKAGPKGKKSGLIAVQDAGSEPEALSDLMIERADASISDSGAVTIRVNV
jgi:hypothetical protein